MKTSVKSAAVLIVAVVVGVIVGALTTSAVMNARIAEIRSLRSPEGFENRMEEVLGPLDAKTREEVEAILRETRERLRELRRAQFRQVRAIMDSTRERLDPLLTEEQQTRLRDMIERDPFRRGSRDRPGPPGRRPGRRPPLSIVSRRCRAAVRIPSQRASSREGLEPTPSRVRPSSRRVNCQS